jgi:hypothetical protein
MVCSVNSHGQLRDQLWWLAAPDLNRDAGVLGVLLGGAV